MTKKALILSDTQIGMMPEGRPDLAEDFVNALIWGCELARDTPECTSVIVTGDMRDTPGIDGEQFGWLMDALDACGDKPMGVLCGNHDMTSPNWIKSATRRIKGIHDLTTPEGIHAVGLNPEEAFALDYKNPSELHEILTTRLSSGKTKTLFLHQAFGEFGASNFADISIPDLVKMIPAGSELTVFAGDIHNYGDATSEDGRIRVFSPGSMQMTDVNEGFNGLPSKQYPSTEGADRKYVLWYDLETGEVTRQTVPDHILRPWLYLKLPEGAKNIPEILSQTALKWVGRPKGIIELKLPSQELNRARVMLQENPGLVHPFDRVRIRVLPDKKTTEKIEELDSGAAPEEIIKRQNWVNRELIALAEEEFNAKRMSAEALELLKSLCDKNAKNKRDVHFVIHGWNKERLDLGELSINLEAEEDTDEESNDSENTPESSAEKKPTETLEEIQETTLD